jgi:hypothetical protein
MQRPLIQLAVCVGENAEEYGSSPGFIWVLQPLGLGFSKK